MFQNKELLDLMKNFYVLTGIRIVLFDEKYNEITSYPLEGTPFCSCMRENTEFYNLCTKSDKIAFETCKKTQALYVYKCHAGLIEATAPITDKGSIIGYIMFGQITDNKNREEFSDLLKALCKKYTADDVSDKIKRIKYKSNKQIVAASKILETCTSYILHKEMIKPSRIQLFNKVDEYIDKHLDMPLLVEDICDEFKISRTRLYELFGSYTKGGIASYIKERRLLKAKELLKSTNKSVLEISHTVGFSDYNYFLRVFKKYYGISPKKAKDTF